MLLMFLQYYKAVFPLKFGNSGGHATDYKIGSPI